MKLFSDLTTLDLSYEPTKIKNQQFGDGDPSTFDSPSPALVQSLIGFPSASGAIVTKDSAMRCITFLSGVHRLSQDIAKMPFHTFQKTEEKGRDGNMYTRTRKAYDHPIYPLLHSVPNPWSTAYQLRYAMVMSLLTNGNFYVQKIENKLGLTGLMLLNPWCVMQRWDYDAKDARGNVVPTLHFDYQDGRTRKTFESSELWWGSILSASSINGQSIVTLGKEAIGILIASDSTAAKFFANGLNMSGFLTSQNPDMEVTEVEAQQIVDRLRDQNRINRGGFTYLPGAVKYEQMQFTAVESQLLESRKYNAEEVIRLLGGAPLLVKLGYGEKNATYAATSAFLADYFDTALLPYTTLIEQTATRDLIDPSERSRVYCKHDADIILRGSPKERAETNKILLDSGQRTGNELRERDDQDPIDGWDYVLFPANSGVYDPKTGDLYMPAKKTEEPPVAQPGLEEGAKTPPDTVQPGQKPPASPAPAKAELPERIRMIVRGEAERCVRKESAQVKKLYAKGATAVLEFYADHAKFMQDNLKITSDEAIEYCSGRIEKLKTEEPSVLFASTVEAVAELEALALGETNEVIA